MLKVCLWAGVVNFGRHPADKTCGIQHACHSEGVRSTTEESLVILSLRFFAEFILERSEGLRMTKNMDPAVKPRDDKARGGF